MPRNAYRRARGFSLVELMIAMTIGLVLITAVLYVFSANQQGYKTTEDMSRMQENARMSFELLARDMREAGSMPCGKSVILANILNPNTVPGSWWLEDWVNNEVMGYDGGTAFPGAAFGTAQGQRVAGTSAVVLMAGSGTGANIAAHNTATAQITLTPAAHGFVLGDPVIICDNNKAALFQVSSVAGPVIGHAFGGTTSPSNCSQYIAVPGPFAGACGATTGTNQMYGPGATPSSPGMVVRVNADAWYVGCNGRGAANGGADCTQDAGRSLYRIQLQNNAGTLTPVAEEIVDGIRDMQITYLVAGGAAYINATAVATADPTKSTATNWHNVVAADVSVIVSSADTGLATTAGAGNATRITRTISYTVSMRNRVS